MAFQYSGYMSVYTSCMNDLRKINNDKFQEIRAELNEGSNVDIVSKHEFWNQYEGTIASVADKVNDTYLKVNSQPAGVASYSMVTGLVLGYYEPFDESKAIEN